MSGDSMIVKVAKAIAVTTGVTDWKVHIPTARAAVRAMREPTTAMLQAAIPDLPDWGYLPDEWQAMIDYVTTEEPNLIAEGIEAVEQVEFLRTNNCDEILSGLVQNHNLVGKLHGLHLVMSHIDHCGFQIPVQLGKFEPHLRALQRIKI